MQWSTLLSSFGTLLSLAAAAPTSLVGTPMATKTEARAASSSSLATWLWESDMISDKEQVADFLSFANTNGITRVYAGINADIHPNVWLNFISQCNSSGIAVDALMGNAQWITGGGYPTLENQLHWIQWTLGNATAPSQRLSGIHFDIEPWSLDDFATNKATYLASYQEIVTTITTFAKSHSLDVAADLPFWANTLTMSNGQKLDAYALSQLDSVTFMTYRNTATGVLSLSTDVLKAGKTAGKKVWLAVETKQAADEGLISYVVKTLDSLTSDLKVILSGAAAKGSCAGVAVHDYHGWRSLSG